MTLPIGSINSGDYELLSLYLDGKLGASERHGLEARLAAEPALQAELDGLTVTIQIMRSAPQIQPPRNFTLDPARYQRRFRLGSYLLLPLGALGTFAAIVLIALGIFLTPTPSTSSNAIALKPTLAAKVNQTAAILAPSTTPTTAPTATILQLTAAKTARRLTADATTAEIASAPAFAAVPTSGSPRPLAAGMQAQVPGGNPPAVQNGQNIPSTGSSVANDAGSNAATTDKTTGTDFATIEASPQNNALAAAPLLATLAATQTVIPNAQVSATGVAIGQVAEAQTATSAFRVASLATPVAKSTPSSLDRQSSPTLPTGQGLLIAGIALLVLSGILLMVAFMRNVTKNLTRTRP